MMIRTIHIIILSLFAACLLTYGENYEIQHIGIEEGLSNSNVVSLAQDREGFIWVATKNGLNRFDGTSFQAFKNDPGNPNSLVNNVLNCVYAENDKDIVWVATEKHGLVQYNYKTQTFRTFSHQPDNLNYTPIANGITHITSDSSGNLWLATYMSGLDYYDRETGRFTHYNQSNINGLGSNYNWYVLYESEERIYVGHVNDGLSIINLNTHSAVNIRHDANDPHTLPGNTVTCIYKDKQGNTWIGTRDGLSLLDTKTLKVTNFLLNPDDPQSISYNFIKSLVEDNDTTLWIGTEGDGISMLDLRQLKHTKDPLKLKFQHIKASNTSDGLTSSSVQSMLYDRFGNFWVGGFNSGLNFIDPIDPFFKQIKYLPLKGNVNSLNDKMTLGLCTDDQQNVWVANNHGGITVYDGATKIKEFPVLLPDQTSITIMSVHKDRKGNIWISTHDGHIYHYHTKTERFKEIKAFTPPLKVAIYNFFCDSQNQIWMSTDLGLGYYNPETGVSKLYNTENSGLTDNVIRTINEDNYGNLWVGTMGGRLCVFDRDFNQLKDLGAEYNFYCVNAIYKDSDGNMWIATQNDLFRFKQYDEEADQRFGIHDGLEENNIRTVVEGISPEEMWLGTINGISYINLQNKTIKNFTVSDGISKGDFIQSCYAKKTDGTIYFGTQNGITYFNQNVKEAPYPSIKPMITSFSIPDVKNSSLNKFVNIPFDHNIKLNYKQNSLQIRFNVMNYALNDKVEFMFKMDGLDDQWYFMDNDKQATFHNLSPGRYTFNLKARLQNNAWSDKTTSIHIHITPPWWWSLAARTIYFVLAVLTIILVLRFYNKQTQMRNALILEKKSRQQEQELHEQKIKFFTNITHELRTPMTLLLGPLEDLMQEQNIPGSVAKKIQSMHRVANRLLQLINQILEFRKTESKNRELVVKKDNFSNFIYEIGLKYTELNTNKNIEFKMDLPDERIDLLFDAEVVTIMLDNILSNAYKYTSKGEITIILRRVIVNQISYIEVEIKDTGSGIPSDELDKIFNRYFQSKSKSQAIGGTGIGLAVVKNLVELHEAEIKVESELKKGTSFSIRFIENNSYPGKKRTYPLQEDLEDEENMANSKPIILIVEDNAEIVEYIHDNLVDSFHVLVGTNGKEGYNIASDKIPDIVLSDIMMPEMDGIEMCKALKQDVRTCHIPVVLLTAKDSLQDRNEGYNAGADSYLTKPFSSTLLKTRLKNILDNRKTLSNSYNKIFDDKKQFFKESTNQMDKDFLEKVTHVIEENLENENLNIGQIAAQMNMSHATLYRKIKALTELTTNEFIRKVRMKVAEQLLITNEYTISEIIYKTGFNSKGYFSRCFKAEYGVPPSEYLKKLKGE